MGGGWQIGVRRIFKKGVQNGRSKFTGIGS